VMKLSCFLLTKIDSPREIAIVFCTIFAIPMVLASYLIE
jgi:hypothetical protein